jgi:hypothetical protein
MQQMFRQYDAIADLLVPSEQMPHPSSFRRALFPVS